MTLVLIVPGFVYQAVKIQLRGRTPSDTDLTARILHAIVASTVFALAYVLVLGPHLVDSSHLHDAAIRHPRLYALLGFAAVFLVPALAAGAAVWIRKTERWNALVDRVRPSTWTRLDPRPSAWDVAFEKVQPCFVRVQQRDGTWMAGWFGEASYASSWPDPRSLFVEVVYHVDASGTIAEPVEGSSGGVIDCTEAVLIELLLAVEPSDSH